MATLMGPVPLPMPIEDHVEEQRHLFCRSYDVCLGKAADEDWASWTCVHCVRFQRLRRARIHEPGRPSRRSLGSRQDGAAAPAEIAGPTRPPSAARPGNGGGRQMVSHSLKESRGVLHMRLEAPSVPALFIEAARAVAEAVRGPPLGTCGERDEEVSIEAPNPERLLFAWIRELVRRSVESRVRFEEFDIVYLDDRRLVASIRGVRVGQMRTPLKTPTYRDPLLVQRPGRITAMPVLDV